MLFNWVRYLLIFVMALAPAFAHGAPAWTDRAISIQTFNTHSRLVFRVDSGVKAEWRSTAQGFELVFKELGLVDLGAPFGGEARWLTGLSDLRDARLGDLKVAETEAGVVVTGAWKFPTGPEAPFQPQMETFEFREKTPSRFVVDFWVKPGPTHAQVVAERERAKKYTLRKKSEEKAKRQVQRRIATLKKELDAADTQKYCQEPVNTQNDIFVRFRAVHVPIDFGKWFSLTTPDSDYPYLEPKGDEKDAQYVRLALSLYRQGKPALAIRTIEFLDTEYPKSSYRNEMHFLRGNALVKLGLQDDANRIFHDLSVTAKGSPVGLHAGLFVAAKRYQNAEYLAALENFISLSRNYPSHRLNWLFRLASAECLFMLKQTARAAEEYQWVAENAQDPVVRARAGLSIGDLYLERQQYAQALAAYFTGLKHFEKEAATLPEVYLNRAEAIYWLGQFDRAEEEFKAFLTRFPSHRAGWMASYRLAEIYDRHSEVGAKAEARKWLYQTVNNHPISPGATLARLRLLPCGDHGGFTYEGAKKYFEGDAKAFAASTLAASQVWMNDYPDLLALSRVRTLVMMGYEGEAVETIAEIFRGRVGQTAREILSDFSRFVFRKEILKRLDAGNQLAALSFYDKYAAIVPGDKDPITSDYLLKLAQAASDLGLGSLSLKIVSTYEKRLGTSTEAKGETGSAKDGRQLATSAGGAGLDPADDDVTERFRRSEEAFTHAKALWLDGGLKWEEKLRTYLGRVSEDSPYSQEKEVLNALMDERKGQPERAMTRVARAKLLFAKRSATIDRQLDYWVATLQEKAGNLPGAIKSIQEIRAGYPEGPAISSKDAERKLAAAAPDSNRGLVGMGVPRLPSLAELFIKEAELLERTANYADSAGAFANAIAQGARNDQLLYGYARVLGKTGKENDREKAVQTLKEILGTKDGDVAWKKLAQEALERTEN